MPGLDALAGVGSAAEQLFIWGVLQTIISELMRPYLQAIDNRVLAGDPNVPLSPAQLAGMVVRGHISESDASHEAAMSGLNADRLHRMIESYGNPPGPEALAEALRRQIIGVGQAGDDAPSYRGGIAQGDLQNKWADVLVELDKRLPGPAEAIDAAIRNIHTAGDPAKLYELFGGDGRFFQFLVDLTGAGPTPVEAGVLLNRGILPEDDPNPNNPSFKQAVRESRFKDKWSAAYAALRFYRPPPRTITAMLHEGRLTPELATPLLKDYGVRDEDIKLYVGQAEHQAVQKAHNITETEIIRLYTEKGIDAATAKGYLVALGYSERDTGVIMAAADLDYQSKLSSATIQAVKSAYLHLHIDRNGVVTRLDAVGVSSVYRDALIELWDLDIATGVKQLTVKQLLDIWGVGLLSAEQATYKLRQIGYSAEDASLLIRMNTPGVGATPAQFAGLSNPGP